MIDKDAVLAAAEAYQEAARAHKVAETYMAEMEQRLDAAMDSRELLFDAQQRAFFELRRVVEG